MNLRAISVLLLSLCISAPAAADMFLVSTNDGPGFAAPEEVIDVLEKGILPTFDALIAMQAEKKIIAGGLPAGSRKFHMIVEADSHDEVDRMLRDLPAWGVFKWKVVPLQSIEGRAEMEKEILEALKAGR